MFSEKLTRPDSLATLRQAACKWRDWATKHPSSETEELAEAAEGSLIERALLPPDHPLRKYD